jgi:plasmid stability protein
MASLTVRKLDEMLKSRLRMRAAANGRSMEEEARVILGEALATHPPRTLADIALEIFGTRHGVELEAHPPATPRQPPGFEDPSIEDPGFEHRE